MFLVSFFLRGLESDNKFRTTEGFGSFEDTVALIDMETLGFARIPIAMRHSAEVRSSCVRDVVRKPTVSCSPGATRSHERILTIRIGESVYPTVASHDIA